MTNTNDNERWEDKEAEDAIVLGLRTEVARLKKLIVDLNHPQHDDWCVDSDRKQ